MDKELKIALGKLLSEIYRLQYHSKDFKNKPNEAVIYGLRNGFEDVIDSEIQGDGWISAEKQAAVAGIFNEYFTDSEKIAELTGFYDIENRLGSLHISRSDAMRIFRLFQAQGRFSDVIAKMDSSNSPSECRKFDLDEWSI